MTGSNPRRWLMVAVVSVAMSIALRGVPSVYPTGTTIFHPDKTWSGYTVFIAPDSDGVILIDMNGRVVREWKDFSGAAGGPARILPGGHVIAGSGSGLPHQESPALVQRDWDGKEVWRFDRAEQIPGRNGEQVWSARQHHDWQRPGFAAGYYAPGPPPPVSNTPTLVLTHSSVTNAQIADRTLEDDRLIEVSWDGRVLWDWRASDHADEFGFSPEARSVIRQSLGFSRARDSYDWLHINAAAYVGPNHWYDEGDTRFAPDNVILSSRESSFIAIVGRSGKIVWRMGPDYRESEALRKLGQIIGQHNPHIIPKGLSGAGNLLVFDNGGTSGYGFANPAAPDGRDSLRRGSSRVVEVNPVTFEKVWEYAVAGAESYRFYSHYVSGAQRLANGNTMITEGADGRIFEVTTGGEIVWEYVSPYFTQNGGTNRVYRAYRVPYEWIPQLPRPAERAVLPPNVREFRVAPQ
jgi:Arylsulfotransferase (ASST)